MSDSEPLQHVIAAVIECEGHYLICRRPAHKRHGLLWEFPGGKLEKGETHLDAARRELKEELNIEVTGIGESLVAIGDPGSSFIVDFIPTTVIGTPELLEHCELRWVTLSQLSLMDLAPSDARFVRFLQEKSQ
jgi:8-oxo-dGTP diphosphatase